MKLPDLASPTLAAWLVVLATVGALTLVPDRPPSDETRIARPPAADVSVNMPAMRGGASDGANDMLPFAYDLGEWDQERQPGLPALADAES